MSYLGSTPSTGTPFSNNKIQVLSGNGSNTQFTLDYRVNSKADIEVIVNNVQQNPFDGSYDVSNNNILTFTGAPSSGANNIHIYFRGYSHNVSVPEANSITSNQLTTTGVVAGTYGNTTAIPVVTIDAAGRVTSATTNSVSGVTGVSWTTANNTLTVSTSTVAYSANVSQFDNPVTFANTVTTKAIVPDANVTYDIGTAGKRFKDIYLANTTIYIGNTTVSETGGSLQISNAGAPAVNLATITEATNLAGNAYSNAIAYSGNAALAFANAAARADAAYTNAVAYAAANTYVNTQLNLKANLSGATFSGAVSGITTLAAGNTTVTGFANVSSTLQVTGAVTFSNTLSVAGNVTGSAANVTIVAGSFSTVFANTGTTTFPGAVSGITTLAAGNTTITGTANVTANLTANNVRTYGSVQIDGDLTVSGNTVTVNATNLSVEDNMIYLNNGSAVTHPDLGIAGNYNDGTYRHAGVFRDATDARWKFFDQYVPEPDASAYIDTANATFRIADVQANTVYAANGIFTSGVSVNGAATFSNTVSVTGLITGTVTSANNADYLDGQHGAYYAANSQLASYALLSGATYTGAVSGITTLAAGNTTITGKLDIGGSSSPLLRLVENTHTGNPKIQLLDIGNADTTITEGMEMWYESSTGHGYLSTIYSTGDLVLRTANTARINIAANGNIGIANSSPASKLFVQGGSTQKTLTLRGANSWHFYSYSDGSLYLNNESDASIIGITQAAPANLLTLASSGVGIGNTSPSHKLSVNGTAYVAGNTTLAGTLSVSGRSAFGSTYYNGYQGYKDSNASAFTMIEITGLNGSGFVSVEIDHGHAGGGMHGAYRRFALKLNAYTDLNFVEDYEYTYGGGSGYTITRPSVDVVRIAWKGATSYSSSFYTVAFIKSTHAFAVSNIGMTSWG